MNLKELEIELIDGSIIKQDISKEVGNLIYQNTVDLGMVDLAMNLYKTGEINLETPSQVEEFKKIIDSGIKAFVRKAIYKLL